MTGNTGGLEKRSPGLSTTTAQHKHYDNTKLLFHHHLLKTSPNANLPREKTLQVCHPIPADVVTTTHPQFSDSITFTDK